MLWHENIEHARQHADVKAECAIGANVGRCSARLTVDLDLTDAGAADLRWRLRNHPLPVFAARRLDAITVEDVDRYRLDKVRAGKLNATSINKTLQVLAAIMEAAVEYDLIAGTRRAGAVGGSLP